MDVRVLSITNSKTIFGIQFMLIIVSKPKIIIFLLLFVRKVFFLKKKSKNL